MTLVGKLTGVYVGDLIVLRGKRRIPLAGYIAELCSAEKVLLSNNFTRDEKTGEVRNFKIFGNSGYAERIFPVFLEFFDSYEVLEKYEAPSSEKLVPSTKENSETP